MMQNWKRHSQRQVTAVNTLDAVTNLTVSTTCHESPLTVNYSGLCITEDQKWTQKRRRTMRFVCKLFKTKIYAVLALNCDPKEQLIRKTEQLETKMYQVLAGNSEEREQERTYKLR